ncbi:nuclear transport factor 2 family protein [Sphingomonas naphthae]|uniref:Nuclear transport factor 2 family protein n=1 Tax=Sphingomonas naphthae TaxID=1813468 RepID=A0ABY7TQQ2_9SPHN|nr:nuclear transport factor 2 family protein [Sphingomonas naphthae]WCT75270.1 nuclear transport factor 2 family protein [Sphingomonas naphthae]
MTIDQFLAREAIRDTMARYNHAGDRLKVDDYVACFAPDGIMETRHDDPAFAFRYEGREAIRDWMSRWLERTRTSGVHGASFVRHHLTTCQIDLTGADTARARTYWIAWTDIGADHAGLYIDSFRKVGAAWLIAHRLVREDWRSPDSLFGAAVRNSR